MLEVYKFLKKCGPFYLASVDGNQPRVRPLGALDVFENKLYIQTGKEKKVAKQMAANPRIEICAMYEDKWIRIEAIVVEDNRIEAQQHMLDANPNLKKMYTAGDGNGIVLYLKDATAIISSFTEASKVIHF